MAEPVRLQRCAVFIDGFNLYHGLKASSGRTHLWLDLEGLSRDLLKPGQTLVSVTYFTAMVRDEPAALMRQDAYLQALESACPKVEVIRGKFQRRTVQCHTCHSKRISYEEKETDVSLAVRLVEGAARNDFDTALLISGDADFVPAIQSARRLKPDLRIVVVFPPKRISDALRKATDASFVLGQGRITNNQLPSTVVSPRANLRRPGHWQ
jgi:uncharacterized LabA/DUF88 family protein